LPDNRSRFPILLIEDSEPDAQIFETALKQASARAQVYWVATAKEGLEFLRREGRFRDVGPAQLVVLDLHLGGENGFDALRQIKSDPELCRTPVVMLTSSTNQDDVDLAYSLGTNAYFKKPMTLEAYIEQVRVIVHHWLDLALLPSPVRSGRSSLGMRRTGRLAEDTGI
jgi:chemotaxis family two-component system response regulator Rcp1